MRDDIPLVPTLIEVGRRTANVLFMILSDKLGDPDPLSEIEVTMFPGTRFRLYGEEAREWAAKLAAFVPEPSAPAPPSRTKVVRRGQAKVSGE